MKRRLNNKKNSVISVQISSGQRVNKWQTLRIIIHNQFSTPFSPLIWNNNNTNKQWINSCNHCSLTQSVGWFSLWFWSDGNTKKNKCAFISFIAAAADWSTDRISIDINEYHSMKRITSFSLLFIIIPFVFTFWISVKIDTRLSHSSTFGNCYYTYLYTSTAALFRFDLYFILNWIKLRLESVGWTKRKFDIS